MLNSSIRLGPSDQLILISSKADNGKRSRGCVDRVIIVFSYTALLSPVGPQLLHMFLCVCICVCGVILFVLEQYGC